MTPTTPYLIRAIYEWCMDQGFTPHLLVDTSIEGVVVPDHLVENDRIVLNIDAAAVRALELGNEWLLFNARFSGKAMDVAIPVAAVRAIFARENGLGCAFEAPAELMQDVPAGDTEASGPEVGGTGEKEAKKKKNKKGKSPHLKLV